MTSTERVRQWRSDNPIRSAFLSLKHNAKRRNIEFGISLDEFKAFVVSCKLWDRRGIEKDSYHIDRIEETVGYVSGNLQMITNEQNIKKYYAHRKYITELN